MPQMMLHLLSQTALIEAHQQQLSHTGENAFVECWPLENLQEEDAKPSSSQTGWATSVQSQQTSAHAGKGLAPFLIQRSSVSFSSAIHRTEGVSTDGVYLVPHS